MTAFIDKNRPWIDGDEAPGTLFALWRDANSGALGRGGGSAGGQPEQAGVPRPIR